MKNIFRRKSQEQNNFQNQQQFNMQQQNGFQNQQQFNMQQQNGFQNQQQVFNQAPVFQKPADPVYNGNDFPIVSEESKKFTRRELKLQTFSTLAQLIISLLVTIAFSGLIGVFVSQSYTFYGGIDGISHLGWMGTLGILSLITSLYFSMKFYGIRKDLTRTRAMGQNIGYVPLSLKKHYRSLRSNNTFIHYFAFLTYFFIGLAILILYLIDEQNGVLGTNLIIKQLEGKFGLFATYLGISASVVLAIHFSWVFVRVRKANVYDAKFGREIVSKEEILALKKRNRKVCLFITIIITIIGVAAFYIVKRLMPSLKLPSLIKK